MDARKRQLGSSGLWIEFDDMQFEIGQTDCLYWSFSKCGLQSEGIDRLPPNQTTIL
jgi:hypothetical protein